MLEHDHSAARGEMTARKLFVFEHESAIGNAPAHKLFETVRVERVNGGGDTPARSFDDYRVTFDKNSLPAGVSGQERF
jgi:CRISPR-associated protein Csd2